MEILSQIVWVHIPLAPSRVSRTFLRITWSCENTLLSGAQFRIGAEDKVGNGHFPHLNDRSVGRLEVVMRVTRQEGLLSNKEEGKRGVQSPLRFCEGTGGNLWRRKWKGVLLIGIGSMTTSYCIMGHIRSSLATGIYTCMCPKVIRSDPLYCVNLYHHQAELVPFWLSIKNIA